MSAFTLGATFVACLPEGERPVSREMSRDASVSQLPISATTMPAQISPKSAKPVRPASVPSSQPNMAPISRLTKKIISPEKYICPAQVGSATIACQRDKYEAAGGSPPVTGSQEVVSI